MNVGNRVKDKTCLSLLLATLLLAVISNSSTVAVSGHTLSSRGQ